MNLRISLLGQFGATLGGRPLSKLTSSDRLQSLLTYLVLNGGTPQSRSQLAFLFWPDATEANARNNLRQLLHQLREALEEAAPSLRTAASWVQWVSSESCIVDATAFQQAVDDAERARSSGDAARWRSSLQRAIELCAGPLAPSCYDDWVVPERERLARKCKRVTQQFVECVEATREYDMAIPHVEHRLRHDPTDEDSYRCLMRLHALCNDRAAALRVYRDCREALKRELDTEPSEQTLLLHNRIVAEDRTIDAGVPARHGYLSSPPLVGRSGEWMALRKAWDAAAAGSARLALIAGEAGIGKSRLAAELVSWSKRQGLATATTRCYAAEGRLALGPVADWLRGEALRPRLHDLEDVWFAEVSRVVPELAAERRKTPQVGSGERRRLFESLARAVISAPTPLLLVIDDLQWCDIETLQWLHFLLRFDPATSLLVVGTVRSEELSRSHPVNELRQRLNEESALTEIPLEPLDRDETAALASQLADRPFDAAAAARLYEETEGNPLFVVELMRGDPGRQLGTPSNRSALPPRVHAVIAGRLAQLSPLARQVVSAAATVARACDVSILARAVNCSESELISALDELWQKRILREREPNTYDFTHDKLREVAYAEMSAPERRSLHRIVALALEAAEASDLDRVSGQIAAQFDHAGLAEMAIPYYIRAAAAALAVYANGEVQNQAERGLEIVLTLPESSKRDAWELELQLVRAPALRIARGWATPALESALNRALALSDKVGTSAQRSQVLYGLQSLYIVQGKHDRAQSVTDEIADLLRQVPSGERPLSAIAMMTGAHLVRGRFHESIAQWEDLLRNFDPHQIRHLQDSQGLNYRVLTCAWQSHALWCIGRPQTALDRCREAVQLACEFEQPFNQALAATYLAVLQQLRGDLATFRRQADEALRLSTQFEAPYYGAWASILVAHAAACERPCIESIAQLRQAIDRFTNTGARLRLSYYFALLGDACLRAQQPESGIGVIEEALAASREAGERWWDAELHRLRGDLLLELGAGDKEAEAGYQRALEIARTQGAKSFELRSALSIARLWRTSSRAEESNLQLRQTLQSFSEGFESRDLVAAREFLAETVPA
jgi:DNA-binding SARP family transcriptional activator/tetratricopeptide (TPR) repeat protein